LIAIEAVVGALIVVILQHALDIHGALIIPIAAVAILLVSIGAAMLAGRVTVREVVDYLTGRGPDDGNIGGGEGHGPRSPNPEVRRPALSSAPVSGMSARRSD
jgi:hypothetical protein